SVAGADGAGAPVSAGLVVPLSAGLAAAGAAVFATVSGCQPAMRRRGTLGSWTGPSATAAATGAGAASGAAGCSAAGSGCGCGSAGGAAWGCGVGGVGGDCCGASVFSTANGVHPTMRRFDIKYQLRRVLISST